MSERDEAAARVRAFLEASEGNDFIGMERIAGTITDDPDTATALLRSDLVILAAPSWMEYYREQGRRLEADPSLPRPTYGSLALFLPKRGMT